MTDSIDVSVASDPFTPVPNYIINDPLMLLETKMTWIYLFSKRNIPGWVVHPGNVQKALGFKDFIWRKVSNQLRELGYLILIDTATGSRLRFVWDWDYKRGAFKPPVDKAVGNT